MQKPYKNNFKETFATAQCKVGETSKNKRTILLSILREKQCEQITKQSVCKYDKYINLFLAFVDKVQIALKNKEGGKKFRGAEG